MEGLYLTRPTLSSFLTKAELFTACNPLFNTFFYFFLKDLELSCFYKRYGILRWGFIKGKILQRGVVST